MKTTLTRRRFIATAGSLGIVVTAGSLVPRFLRANDLDEAGIDPRKITAWVQVTTDGKITIYNPAAEMGQGSMTALAVVIAEEMDADWEQVKIENAPVIPEIYGMQWSGKPGGPMITAGSRTIRTYYPHMRQAGAQARYVLMSNAAEKWGVPLSEVTTEPGVVVHKSSGKKMTYGEIVAFVKIPESIPPIADKDLKKSTDFRLIGKVIPRIDLGEKSNGSAQFGIDVQVPGMVYGVISRSPVFGTKPTILNEKEIRESEGVIDVAMLDHGVGVIASTYYQASNARKKLKIKWSEGARAADYDSEAAYNSYHTIVNDESKKGRVVIDEGDTAAALKAAHKIYEQEYRNDYVYHARMEPMNAVVAVAADGKSAEAWAGTQAPDADRDAIADVLKIEPEKVTFHNCYLGGGFGGRQIEFSREAAILSNKVKRPVKLIWTREDDLQYGSYRPIGLHRLQAGVDAKGMITGWRHYVAGPDERLQGGAIPMRYYEIPNHYAEHKVTDDGVRTVYWRSVSAGPVKFAQEAFLDEMANDQKIDPYQFRRRMMQNLPRYRAILDNVARLSNWETPAPDGRARGMSFTDMGGSYAAGVVEISVDKGTGKIRVHRVWATFDSGVVVLADGAKAQMEGGIVMGISSVLNESITFKNGRVQQSNFHDYPLLRMAEAPETVEINHISSDAPPTSMGELSLPLMGGAIANAFLKLTGKSLRHMPFTPEKVLAVLKS
jgi:isoquinoline 1-oxidoreductase beta subunit